MSKAVFEEGDEGVRLIVKSKKSDKKDGQPEPARSPVHVVYGGADRFSPDTPRKLGDIALRTIETYAPNFVEFANAMAIPGTEALSRFPEAVSKLEKQLSVDPGKLKALNYSAWFAWTIYTRTVEKLRTEPVEDFRIDFEDGYGFRSSTEEDDHAAAAARSLAAAFTAAAITPFSGFRIKSLGPATYGRAIRTLNIFLETLLENTGGKLPDNFVVTLPKVSSRREVKELYGLLARIERSHGLKKGIIGIELMIETAASVINKKGRFAPGELVAAGKGRITSAHFGAFDHTSALGIASEHQRLGHPACNFARQAMLVTLSPLGIRLSDSVTTHLPVPLHRTEPLSELQSDENRRAVHAGWKVHFANVTRSMSEGFYQSWDLHPNQLPARYAAVYAFFLSGADEQGKRLREFLENATRANLAGAVFDDAASAQGILNYFRRAVACGALTAKEAELSTGLSTQELNSKTFLEIAEERR
jgi:citrate lyase beta subunit